jgi:DNA-directed RNA polymerase specialized sigma subunit
MKKNKSLSKNDKRECAIDGLSCFAAHEELGMTCEKKSCRYWHEMEDKSNLNCIILAAKKGPMTLQQVGEMFNVTRMRVCQIEKTARKFLKGSAPTFLADFKDS